MTPFEQSLTDLLQHCGIESPSDTPAEVLALYLHAVLDAYTNAVRARGALRGRVPTSEVVVSEGPRPTLGQVGYEAWVEYAEELHILWPRACTWEDADAEVRANWEVVGRAIEAVVWTR